MADAAVTSIVEQSYGNDPIGYAIDQLQDWHGGGSFAQSAGSGVSAYVNTRHRDAATASRLGFLRYIRKQTP